MSNKYSNRLFFVHVGDVPDIIQEFFANNWHNFASISTIMVVPAMVSKNGCVHFVHVEPG